MEQTINGFVCSKRIIVFFTTPLLLLASLGPSPDDERRGMHTTRIREHKDTFAAFPYHLGLHSTSPPLSRELLNT
jgi:hypothetical protein